MTEELVTCSKCDEVQSKNDHLCARCGASMETREERARRLAALEQSRREAERNDVATRRLPGFGDRSDARTSTFSNKYFAEMSNQMRRRYIILVASLMGVCVIFVIIH